MNALLNIGCDENASFINKLSFDSKNEAYSDQGYEKCKWQHLWEKWINQRDRIFVLLSLIKQEN